MRTALMIFIATVSLLMAFSFVHAADVQVTAIVPGCGDGIVGSGEQCDGTNFNGASCATVGFSSGTLSCSSLCLFVTSACVIDEEGGQRGGSARRISHRSESIPSVDEIYGALRDILLGMLNIVQTVEHTKGVVGENTQETEPDSFGSATSSLTTEALKEEGGTTTVATSIVDSSNSLFVRLVLVSGSILVICIIIHLFFLRKRL